MKKTLIALAAVAATGAAFAQSSVTLYGVADISIGDDNRPGSKLSASANGAAGPTGTGINNGNSRWGVRGTEDLGGGLKAGFNFEGNLSLADGSNGNGITTGTSTRNELFQRAANVSLSGGFGSLTAGRQLNPSFYSVASWELTGTANYSAVGKQFGQANGGTRDDAMVAYVSPNFGGLTASIGTVLKGNGAPLGSGNSKTDMALTYKAGPATASLAYNKVQNSKANMTIGGKYDLGVATIAASFNDHKSGAVPKKGFTLGASAPMGPVTLTVDLARATNTAAKNTDYLLEAKYALSKRTFAYAAFLSDGGIGAAATVKTWGLGVRHNF